MNAIELSQFNGHYLLAHGYVAGPALGAAMVAGRALLANGEMAETDFLAKLNEAAPVAVARQQRGTPAPLAEAIRATCALDEDNIAKVRELMGQLMSMPVIEAGAIMPDACPAGVSEACIPVGGAIVARNAILPASHSSDLCCSMNASFFLSSHSTSELMDVLQGVTRFGRGGRRPEERIDHPVLRENVWKNPFLRGLEILAAQHLADQGDGNHFAYIGRMSVTETFLRHLNDSGYARLAGSFSGHKEVLVLVTHHGSRKLGADVYARGMDAAIKHTRRIAEGIPPNGAWLDATSEEGEAYWEALQYVGRWTRANHEAIHERFIAKTGATRLDGLFNAHNYIWKRGDLYFHGKGATPAWKDDKGRPLLGLIPLNMGAEILLVLGNDNEKYLSFAPHGAGRNQSRSATAKTFKDADGEIEHTRVRKSIAAATPGIDVRWYSNVPDITESPLGYKPAAQVKAQIEEFGLATIIAEIQPLGCIMAGAMPNPWDKDRLSKKQVRQIGHRSERRTLNQKLKSGQFEETE